MNIDVEHIDSLPSTNEYLTSLLRENRELKEGYTVVADHQTAGKGQQGNHWEAMPRKNLLFSLLLRPAFIRVEAQFLLSQLVSVAVVQCLKKYDANFAIKWPNDIYWNDKKVGGILIENRIKGDKINSAIVGVGINVNQEIFSPELPNPISLKLITKEDHARQRLFDEIVANISALYSSAKMDEVRTLYAEWLYRKRGHFLYRDCQNGKIFSAEIAEIAPDGQLVLRTDKAEIVRYYFKEVEFVL